MKVLVLAALIAVVTSSHNPKWQWSQGDLLQGPWQQGKLYTYEVDSHTLARLHEGPSTGNAFKYIVKIRVSAPGRLQARLENPQLAVVHEELNYNQVLPANLKYQPAKYNDQPFEILLEGGRVKTFNVPSKLSLDHENLLKGLLSALQIDLSSQRVHGSENSYDAVTFQGQFKKMETDVTGDCETLYTVTPVASEWRRELPKFTQMEDPIEITKTKDYGHCHHRVSYHFGVPHGAEWTGTARDTDENQFLRRATISRILTGKQGPILKSETTSTANVHALVYGKQKATVVSYMQLNLISFEDDKEGEWPMTEKMRSIKNLLYAMSSKQVTIDDRSSSSSSSESQEELIPQEEQVRNRERRSAKPGKIVSINKIVLNKNSDEDQDSSSSSDSSSTYINDDIPENESPAYISMYMKQNPMNAQKLVQELAQQLQNPNNMPKSDFLSKFNILVRVIGAMSVEQLNQASRSIEVAKSSNNIVKSDMWMVYRDAVAQAGTIPAFQQIRTWIQKKTLQGEEAAEVVATLARTLRYPTKETMIQFFKMAMSPEVMEQKYLNSTALIAATRFINMGQVNNETAHSYYPTHMYGRLAHKHDNFVVEQILPRLQDNLAQAIQQQDSKKAQVYIKAIGNLGHRAIMDVFTPYLEGKIPTTNYLRALMVDNLRTLAHQRDRYVRAVLFNILKNTAEPYEVRVAAIQTIFMARPSSVMMQTMAQMTQDDPSIQVRAAIKSAILTAAQLENPRYWKLARTAQAVAFQVTKEKFGQQYSSRRYTEYFDSEFELGIVSRLAYTGSEDSIFPKNFDYALKTKASGWSSISATFSDVEEFFRHQWNQPSSEPKFKYSAQKISEMLQIKRDAKNPLEAAFYIKLLNQERYFTFNEDDIKQMPQIMKEFAMELSKGMEKHYTKVLNQAQITVVFPLATGMPFIYKYREPTVIHFQAKAKGDIKFPGQEQRDFSSKADSELQLTFARNLDGSVGFLDTLSNKVASVGVINKIQMSIPMKVQTEMQRGQIKIQMQHLRPEMDTLIAHYSVWPYTANQKRDSLVPVSSDSETKVISRRYKVSSVDTKFGQSTSSLYQVQGYSYSKDLKNVDNMFQTPDLISNIMLALYQKDMALTHYNLRYLGKQSQSKGVTLTAMYDTFYNQKQGSQGKLEPINVQDVRPDSDARRQEMVKRVAAGINTATVRVVDLSAQVTGLQTDYVLTVAYADSPVDPKIQYAFFAGKNSPQDKNQINGVGKINMPEVTSMNFLQALQKDLKINYESEIRFGQDYNGMVHIQVQGERTPKYTEALKEHPRGKLCAEEIARDNYYQSNCHNMIVKAHTPDHYKGSIDYKNVSPTVKYVMYKAYKLAEHYNFWDVDANPLKMNPEGRIDFEMQNFYLDGFKNFNLNTKMGEARFKNVPISKVWSRLWSLYRPIRTSARVGNYFLRHQYQPFCSVDGNRIRTFSDRSYEYTLNQVWHVLIQDMEMSRRGQQVGDELVVLAKRPSEKQQHVYISYRSQSGKNLEIEIKPSESTKQDVKVTTDSKKVSEGDLTTYWDDVSEMPLLQYYAYPDGVMMLNIAQDRLQAMYDGQRLVVLAEGNRNNTRGICGYMSGEPRDDFLTPQGMVDDEKIFAASYALNQETADPEIQQLQEKVKQTAYQTKYHYTHIMKQDQRRRSWSNSQQL